MKNVIRLLVVLAIGAGSLVLGAGHASAGILTQPCQQGAVTGAGGAYLDPGTGQLTPCLDFVPEI